MNVKRSSSITSAAADPWNQPGSSTAPMAVVKNQAAGSMDQTKFTFDKRSGTCAIGGQLYEINLLLLVLLYAETQKREGKIERIQLASNLAEAGAFDDVVFKCDRKDVNGSLSSLVLFIQAKHKETPKQEISVEYLMTGQNKGFDLVKYFIDFRNIKEKFATNNNDEDPIFTTHFEDCQFIIFTNNLFDKENDFVPHKVNDTNVFYIKGQDTFYHQIDFSANKDIIVEALKDSSDCKILAKELATCISRNSSININVPIIKKYHFALLNTVLEDNHFKKSFLEDGGNLSSEDKIFRGAFFDALKTSKRESDDDIKKKLSNKVVKKHDNFVISPNSPQRPLPSDFEVLEDEMEEFLDKLQLYVGQMGQSDVANLIKRSIESTFDIKDEYSINVIYNSVLSQMQRWWKEEAINDYLTEKHEWFEEAKRNLSKLKLIGLALHNIAQMEKLGLSFNKDDKLEELIRNKEKRLLKMVTDANTAILTTAKLHQTLESINVYKTENDNYKYISMKLGVMLNLKNEVLDTFQTKETNLLVIECIDTDDNIEKICEQLSYIIKHNDRKTIVLIAEENNKFADKLSNSVKNTEYSEVIKDNISLCSFTNVSQEHILQKKVCFQGNVMHLSRVIDEHSKHLIHPEVINKLINNEKINIGKPADLGDIKHFYIDRTFQLRRTIKAKYFKTVCSKIKNQEFKLAEKNNLELVLLDETSSEQQDKMTNIHSFKKCNGKFIWQNTCGSVSNLRKFVDEQVEEFTTDDMSSIPGQVVIISAEPGMGKSTVLTKLAMITSISSDSWFVRVNLNDHTSTLVEIANDIEEKTRTLLFRAAELSSSLEQDLFEHRFKHQNSKMTFFIDGFDEICPDYKEIVIQILQVLQKTGNKIIITTRPYTSSELEETFGLLSFGLKPLCRYDQMEFLKMFWRTNLNKQINEIRTKKFIIKLLNILFNSISDAEAAFTGLPLQTRMLAEAFHDKFKEFHDSDQDLLNLPKRLNIYKLYQLFINEKYKIHSIEKKKQDGSNSSVKEEEKIIKTISISEHRLLALNVLFNNQKLDNLLPACKLTKLEEIKRKVKKGIERKGIVSHINDDTPIFSHRTFAEYFAAEWFRKHFKEKHVSNFLRDELFRTENSVIQHFFDRALACDDSPTNTNYELQNVVLNKDIDTLNTLLPLKAGIYINSVDEAGRTALHLAAAYGYSDIVCVLLNHGADVNIADLIFGWKPLNYASKNSNWCVAELLLQNGASSEHIFQSLSDVERRYGFPQSHFGENTLLHVAAKEGYTKLAEIVIEKCTVLGAFHKYGGIVHVFNNQRNTPLVLATKKGNLELIKCLVKHHADINVSDAKGRTSLHLAAARGHTEIIKHLVKNKADIHISDINGWTSVHWAVSEGHTEIVKCLVQNKAGINASDKDGLTPLHQAAARGHTEIVKCLLKHSADINAPDKNGRTPLHWAAAGRHIEIVKYLVENHADINASDIDGRTSLHWAVARSYTEIIKCLVELKANINAFDKNGWTPLHHAAAGGHTEIIKCLVKYKADIKVSDADGCTPLLRAADEGHTEAVKYLVENNADINVYDTYGFTALHRAAVGGHTETIIYIAENNADIKISDKNNWLLQAAAWGDTKIVKCLVKNNVDINVSDTFGWTPLHWAAAGGHTEIVKCLVENNADVNVADTNSWTPLYWAVAKGHTEIIKYLVVSADINVPDTHGWTCLHRAADGGHSETVKLLIEHKADINICNNQGETPLHLVTKKGHLHIVKFLLERGATFSVTNAGRTVLGCAIDGGLETVQYLVEEQHVDVNEIYIGGQTALQYAISKGKADIADYLVSKGARST